jgi:transcriptional regulator
VAEQIRGIVGIEMLVTHVDAKAKLNQNRPEADRAGVIEGLRTEPTDAAHRLADTMESSLLDGR